MNITLLNHSSLLFSLNNNKNIFLTDFWNLSPAFGSWLPSVLPFYNPTYLASLSYKPNFYLIISHAHDDHIDDDFLRKYFNKDMKIIISKFPSPSLGRRLNKLGFENLIHLDIGKEKKFKDFEAITVVDETVSNDDSSIVLRDKKYGIFHGNDNWPVIKKENLLKVKKFIGKRTLAYAAQTNSASGYPLSYPEEKNKSYVLKNVVKKMLFAGFENANNLKAKYFIPYVGYAKPYIKDKDYYSETFNPIYSNLTKLIKKDKIKNKNKLVNIFCGGTLSLKTGKVTYPFNYDPMDAINITDKFVRNEGILEKCDTYNKDFNTKMDSVEVIKSWLKVFNEFVSQYAIRFPKFYPETIGKKLRIIVKSQETEFMATIEVGSGKFLNDNSSIDKKFEIPENLFMAMIEKKIVWENFYTGYEAEITRYPKDNYNKGLLNYLNMFGYKYKNQKI